MRDDGVVSKPFTYTAPVRYFEVDQQGVVFNMWYLGYLDEAFGAFMSRNGMKFSDIVAAGVDVQLVHTELDWAGSLRLGDTVHVEVGLARVGRTSLTVQFSVHAGDPGKPVAAITTVYVVIATDGSGSCSPPRFLLDALGPVAPLRELVTR